MYWYIFLLLNVKRSHMIGQIICDEISLAVYNQEIGKFYYHSLISVHRYESRSLTSPFDIRLCLTRCPILFQLIKRAVLPIFIVF